MKNILVVDDDFQQRDLYIEFLRSKGFVVTGANDGQDAWEKIQKQKPDLVFTGIAMPRMTGFELIEKLRATPATASLPIIVFSHLGREEDKKRAKALGVEFKIKGYDGPVEILQAVEELLTPKKSNKPLSIEDDTRSGAASI